MKILNVIQWKSGIIRSIDSFVQLESVENQNPIIAGAEKMFGDLIESLSKPIDIPPDADIDSIIEDSLCRGFWENSNGYEIVIKWSNVIIW